MRGDTCLHLPLHAAPSLFHRTRGTVHRYAVPHRHTARTACDLPVLSGYADTTRAMPAATCLHAQPVAPRTPPRYVTACRTMMPHRCCYHALQLLRLHCLRLPRISPAFWRLPRLHRRQLHRLYDVTLRT